MASRSLSIKKLVRKISTIKQPTIDDDDDDGKEGSEEMTVIHDYKTDEVKKVNFSSNGEENREEIPKPLKTLAKKNSIKVDHDKVPKRKVSTEPPRKCGVCHGQFKQPKMLPCNHTFCLECLQRYVNPRQMLGCPKCHQELHLDSFGLEALPDNLAMVTNSREARICFTCNRDCITLGQLCLHCNKVYCKVCLRSHAGVLQEQYQVMKDHLEDTLPQIDQQANCQQEMLDDLLIKADEVVEKQISVLKNKRKELGESIVQIRDDSKQEFEVIKAETKVLIDCLGSLMLSAAGRDTADELKMATEVQNTYQVVLQKQDVLKNKNCQLHEETLTLSCSRKKKEISPPEANVEATPSSIQRKKSKKLVRTDSKPPAGKHNSTENSYKNCHLEEVSKLRWSSCQQPLGAATCPWTGDTWVCGAGSRDVAVFGTTGTCTSVISSTQFLFPCSVAFMATQRKALVLDRRQHCIWVVGDNHEVERSIGKNGSRQGCFSNPSSLAVDARGRIMVTDTGNNRVHIIDINGIFVGFIGVYKEEGVSGSVHELVSPSALSISPDGKTVAVADSGNNRIRLYSAGSGRALHQWGMRGRGHGQMERPCGVAWLNQGVILVLDEGRIQLFTGKREFLRSIAVKDSVSNVEVLGDHVLLYDTNMVVKAVVK